MEPITLKTLAAELGMDRSHLRKFVLKMEIEPLRVRTPDSRNQATLALIPTDADRVRTARAAAGFSKSDNHSEVRVSDGQFYIAAMDIEARPNRIKVGYTDSLDNRVASYRTGNPDVQILRTWPCKRAWEAAVIDAVTNLHGCQRVSGEVYDCKDVDALVARGDAFFAMLDGR